MEGLPEAGEWYVRRRLDDDITLITEPHVHPFLRCNVWHVRGRDRDVVVDTAMGIRPLRRFVERELSGPLLAVATHAHPDHVGGLHEFSERAIHPAEAHHLDEPAWATVETEFYGPTTLGPYRAAGYDIPDLLVDAVPTGGLAATTYQIAAAPATQLLVEGDAISLGDRSLEVLHLPGHSPGSIGLWEERTGVLFSGDAVYDGPLLDQLEDSSIEDYARSLRRLRHLPVRVVHGGHEASFGAARLAEICDDYLRRHDA